MIELLDRGAWWPMRVVGRRKGGLRLLSDVHAAGGEKERFGREKVIRPSCTWQEESGRHVYKLGGHERGEAALCVEVYGKARLVGFEVDSAYNGLTLNVLDSRMDGRWRLGGRGTPNDLWVAQTNLQAAEAAPVERKRRSVSDAAKDATKGWLQAVKLEAKAIAESLQMYTEELRVALQPRQAVPVHEAAFRSARRNFANVDELRAALQSMDKGKTGRTTALEQLLHLDDHVLAPWLLVTEMLFAGEAVDELKLGTVSPLPKDLARFRPVTLLEPIYKCCMAAMAGRLLSSLHEYGLLDAAQYGFVVDGSCV